MKRLSAVDKIYLLLRFILIAAIWLAIISGQQVLVPLPYRNFVLLAAVVFTFYGLVFAVSLFLLSKHHHLFYLVVLPLDLLAISFAIRCTGPNSLFYLGYVAIITLYALCFKKEVGLGVALAMVILLLIVGGVPLISVRFLLQASFLFSLAFIMCSIAEKEKKEKQEIERLNQVLYDSNVGLNKRALELNAISEIAMSIHSTLELDKLARLVLSLLKHILDLDICALIMMEKKTEKFVFLAAEGMSPEEAKKVFLDELARRGLSSLEKERAETEQLSFFKCLPLLSKEDAIVALCASAEKIGGIGRDDMVVLSAIASELAIALENARLYELTKTLSITDELTGLFNYRLFYEELKLELERAERYTRPLSIIMIDIDDFKLHNDTYGHIQGDKALAEVAQVLKENCREFDVLARYGGEEFAIVLPETAFEGAYAFAEKIRQAVANYKFEGNEGERGAHLTISVGLASYPLNAATLENLVKEADGALYEAKTTGRNRVCAPKID